MEDIEKIIDDITEICYISMSIENAYAKILRKQLIAFSQYFIENAEIATIEESMPILEIIGILLKKSNIDKKYYNKLIKDFKDFEVHTKNIKRGNIYENTKNNI